MLALDSCSLYSLSSTAVFVLFCIFYFSLARFPVASILFSPSALNTTVRVQRCKKIKILSRNTLLIEISGRGKRKKERERERERRKKKKISPASQAWPPAQLFCPPLCLPDYDRPQHTQGPQSMPHATLQHRVHTFFASLGVTPPRPANINRVSPSYRVITAAFPDG